jgi:hypothetical protein
MPVGPTSNQTYSLFLSATRLSIRFIDPNLYFRTLCDSDYTDISPSLRCAAVDAQAAKDVCHFQRYHAQFSRHSPPRDGRPRSRRLDQVSEESPRLRPRDITRESTRMGATERRTTTKTTRLESTEKKPAGTLPTVRDAKIARSVPRVGEDAASRSSGCFQRSIKLLQPIKLFGCW